MPAYSVAVIRGVLSYSLISLYVEFINHGLNESFRLGAYCGDPVCHYFNLGKRLRLECLWAHWS